MTEITPFHRRNLPGVEKSSSLLGECCFTGLRRKDRNWTRHRIASVARTPSRMTEITPFHRRNLPGVEKNSSLLGEGCSIKTSLRPSASAISHRSSVRYLVLLTTRRSRHRTIPQKESP